MKKMKKFFAVILSLAMVLGMSITAFAATNKTSIVVNNLDKDATIKYVQIIEPSLTEPTGWRFTSTTYADAFRSSDVNATYRGLTDQQIIWKLIKMNNDDATNMPEGTTAMTAGEFQKALEGITATNEANITYSNGTATIGEIASAGIYVVKADSTGNYTYNPMAAYVSFDSYDTTTGIPSDLHVEPITAKSKTVEITKTSSETDKVVAVGKQVKYTVTTQIPYVSDSDPITKYEIIDTISGANYVTENGKVAVSVKVGNETAKTVSVDVNNNSITIPLTSYLGLGTKDLNKHAHETVVIEYYAEVTELTVNNSVVPGDGVHNFVPATDTLYTGTVTLTKTGENSAPLKDAKFVLVDPVNNKYALVTYVPAKEATDTTEAEDAYYKVTGWTTSLDEAKANTNLIVTDDQGKAVVKGLDDNVNYEFKEVVAPNGYSINETNATTDWTDKGNATTANDRQGTTSMNDTKLSSLPSTGGIGTTIFTIAGCAIMIAAAGFFFASRKKANR